MLARTITFPLPVVAGVAYVQLPSPDTPAQGPEWLIGAVAGIWLVVWLLDKLGKLPGGSVERRRGPRFEDEDREALRLALEGVQKLREHLHQESARHSQFHQIFTFRSEDGIERWLRHHQITVESRTLLQELARMTKEVHDLRRDEQRKTGLLVSTLEANQKVLVRMQHQLEDLEQVVNETYRRNQP